MVAQGGMARAYGLCFCCRRAVGAYGVECGCGETVTGEEGLTVGDGTHVDRLLVETRSRRLAWKSGGMVLVAVACLGRALAPLR